MNRDIGAIQKSGMDIGAIEKADAAASTDTAIIVPTGPWR